MTKESAIQRDIQKQWRKLKGWVFKVHGNEFTGSGIPDLVGCVPLKITKEMVGDVIGVFVALEVKRDETEDASLIQLQTIEEIKDAKGYALVAKTREQGYEALREAGLVSKGSGRLCNKEEVMRLIHGAGNGKNLGKLRNSRSAARGKSAR
jgi:hypothetical protein